MAESKFKISLTDALGYITNYVTKVMNADHKPVPKILGGTVSTELIFKQKEFYESLIEDKLIPKEDTEPRLYEGLVGWFCWDKENDTALDDTKFFLSFEINDSIRFGIKDSQIPDFPLLASPVSLFNLSQLSTDQLKALSNQEIKQLIENDILSSDQKSKNGIIERGYEFKEMGKVLNLTKKIRENGPTRPMGKAHVKYIDFPFGLFENKESGEVDEFLKQKNGRIPYIKYFFGYNPDISENKIRIILIGADENGEAILPSTINEDKKVNDEAIILQTSWPPMTL